MGGRDLKVTRADTVVTLEVSALVDSQDPEVGNFPMTAVIVVSAGGEWNDHRATVKARSVTIKPGSRDEGPGVTAEMIRILADHWDGIVAEAVSQHDIVTTDGDLVAAITLDRALADPAARRAMKVDHLVEVARVYREATARGGNIEAAIIRAFPGKDGKRVAKSTVFRWVAKARELGLLERGD